MNYFRCWRCNDCGEDYALDEVRYLCPACSRDYKPGMPLPGVLEGIFEYVKIGNEWDFEPDLGKFEILDRSYYPPLPVGNTPFFLAERLAAELCLPKLYIKFDGLNPSGSLKDRASELVVADANRLGIREIVCASTGNAASSLACLCAAAGKKAVIFAPASAPAAKLAQIRVHGAELHAVKGSYDDAFAAALEYSQSHECLCRNTAYNPLTIEGKKSAGFEIWRQLGSVPDWIVVPVGDGVILAGIFKAYWDLFNCGIIDNMPKLLAVQASSSDAITSYWETGVYRDAAGPETIADSISVRTPANAHGAVWALKTTEGKAVRVYDDAILRDQKELARKTGVFAEPSSAATLSGLLAGIENEWIKQEDKVVLLVTGHGLKDIDAVN